MFFLIVFLLIALDIFSKVIINFLFMDASFKILNGLVTIKPFLNTDSMSLFNGLVFNLNVSLKSLIIINIVLLILMIPLYLYLKSIRFKSVLLCSTLIFLMSGAFASTVDRLVWGGSLDFILIYGYIIDFKDIYLFLSIITATLFMIKEFFIFFFRSKKSYRL